MGGGEMDMDTTFCWDLYVDVMISSDMHIGPNLLLNILLM